MYDFLVSLLEGVDLERFDFIIPLIMSVLIILCIALTFRALIAIFNTFFGRK